jgi:hypothetical protein
VSLKAMNEQEADPVLREGCKLLRSLFHSRSPSTFVRSTVEPRDFHDHLGKSERLHELSAHLLASSTASNWWWLSRTRGSVRASIGASARISDAAPTHTDVELSSESMLFAVVVVVSTILSQTYAGVS